MQSKVTYIISNFACLINFMLIIPCLHAQVHDSIIFNSPVLETIEYISEQNENNTENSEIESQLYEQLTNRLNINTASITELTSLGVLSDKVAQNIITYRDSTGYFLSIPELLLVNGIDTITYNQVSGFLKAEIPITGYTPLFSNIKQQYLLNIGYSLTDTVEPHQQPFKILNKYKINANNKLQAGFIAENDAGEALFSRQNKTFDYVSAYVAANKIGMLKTLVVGDYKAQFAQGLVLWNGFAMASPLALQNYKRSNSGFKPNTSANENNFFRGFASTLQFGNIEMSAMYSQKYIDANISEFDSINNKPLAVSSLINTGIHVKPTEIENKHALLENVWAGNLQAGFNNFSIGTTLAHVNYAIPIIPMPNLYNKFAFTGKTTTTASINYNANINNTAFFGEIAQNNNKATAFINGILVNPSYNTTLLLMHRYYSKNYFAPFANAYSKSSSNNNENGITLAFTFMPTKKSNLTLFADQCTHQWLKYRVSKPFSQYEYYTQYQYTINAKLNFYLRYSLRQSQQDITFDTVKIIQQQKVQTQHYRLQINVKPLTQFENRTRLEVVAFNKATQNTQTGILAFNEVYWQINNKVNVSTRYTWYNTTGYDTRIYAYDPNVLHSWPIQMYYNTGSSISLLCGYTPSYHTRLKLKCSLPIKQSLIFGYVNLQMVANF